MIDRPPIAVVGAGAVVPGADSPAVFWRNIVAIHDASRPVPSDRWTLHPDAAYASEPAPDRVCSKHACLIDPFALDPAGLDVDADLLARLDPVYHVALHAGRQAYEDARMEGLDRERIGVILAAIALPTDGSSAISREVIGHYVEDCLFERMGRAAPRRPGARRLATHPLNARVTGLPAALLARALRLGGGAWTLDAACASSLYAIKLACDELFAGRADAMLAGGVSRPDCLYTQMGFTQLRSLSPSGRCAPFDARADGLVVGEGAAVFVLKRLEDALRDGDTVYGVIRGIGLSNDIGGSLLAPDSDGQLRAMRQAYDRASWTPDLVDLIECHGTGTPLGDAVELRSLRALWSGLERDSRRHCRIGSVKSMIGHLLTAAGGAGLLKVLLGMRHGVLPPSAHFERPADDSPLHGAPFRVQTRAEPWERRGRETPRRAAISAFGFGGINAHVLIEEWTGAAEVHGPIGAPIRQSQRSGDSPAEARSAPSEPIAIVGMAVRLGPVTTLRDFSDHVLRGRPALRACSPRRWHGCQEAVRTLCGGIEPVGAYVEEITVPIGRFKLPPNEIPAVLPQQLLMLMVAAEAMEDARLDPRRRTDVGAFIGMGLDLEACHFHLRWWLRREAARRASAAPGGATPAPAQLDAWIDRLLERVGPPLDAPRTLGALGGMVASRVAREFGLGGPSFGISCNEASGLRALEIAARALQRGELNAAIVGAVDLCGDARAVAAADGLRPWTRSGRAAALEAAADGCLPGEGAAAVVVKRLSDAKRDGDTVYAVIRGIGSASGGGVDRAIESAAIQRAIRRSWDDAQIHPAAIGYVECHGSGSPEEDSAELHALAACLAATGARPAMGALKPFLGNAGAAAGLASLVKAAMVLQAELLPALPAFTRASDPAAAISAGLHVPRRPQYWLHDRESGPRAAGVTAMTADGNCIHVVLEQTPCDLASAAGSSHEPERARPARRAAMDRATPPPQLPIAFVVRAAERVQLGDALGEFDEFISAHAQSLDALRRQWHANHPQHGVSRTLVLLADSRDALRESARSAAAHLNCRPDDPIDGAGGVYYAPRPLASTGRLAFVFPGSGSHFAGMGADIGLYWPEVYRQLDGETGRLASHVMPERFWPRTADWSEGWQRRAAAALGADPRALIFGQVAYCVVMSDLLCRLGLRPDAAIGYSLGESAALFALRAWPDRDEMFRRMHDSPLFATDLAGPCDAVRAAWNIPRDQAASWRAVLVPRPAGAVRAALADLPHARLLIVNTPTECVMGGLAGDVDACLKRLNCRGVPLEGVPAVHCDVVRAVEPAYRALHDLPTTAPAGIAFYSAVRGQSYDVTRASAADSITGQALHGFDFPGLIEQAWADGVRMFVEVGPQATCTRMIARILDGRSYFAMSASARGESEPATVVRLLAALAAQGVAVDWQAVYAAQDRAAEAGPELQAALSRHGAEGSVVVVPLGSPEIEPTTDAGQTDWPPRREVDSTVPHRVRDDLGALAECSCLDTRRTEDVPVLARVDSVEPLRRDGRGVFEREGFSLELVAAVARTAGATARAQDAYLRFTQTATAGLGALLASGIGRAATAPPLSGRPAATHMPVVRHAPPPAHSRGTPSPSPAYDRDACLEFARGRVSAVFGPRFAEVDTFPVRVRLPDEPLMLVDRILSIEGSMGSLSGGRLVTEHDVLPGAWYLDGGRAPVCITVEAGQADLFLSSFLGIDLAVRGQRAYRLLDATVTFHRRLPAAGETIRYEITIDRFVRRGATFLFFFRFDGTIDGRPMLSMRDGCAGFFTAEEVEHAGGVILKADECAPVPGRRVDDWQPLVAGSRASYDEAALAALRRGDLGDCFGPAFAGLPLREPVRLPDGRMRLIHRILDLDPTGGRFGLGRIRAAADIRGDEWFLTCHFVDDQVMPGTLMYECCVHTLRFFLMRMGWVSEQGEVCYEPIPGVASGLRCRGPVTPQTREVIYEVDIKELGYRPEPYALADAMMYGDGRRIVRMTNMSVQLTGVTRERLEAIWRGRAHTSGPQPELAASQAPGRAAQAAFERRHILAFAVGRPSEAFGEPYRVFDERRRIARLPGPPYSFIDRVTEIEPAPWGLRPSGWITAEYDVPPDAWYFAENRQPSMPFCVLLEAALQPCGWLAAYLGSALHSETDLRFRNLGGRAVLHETIPPDAGTLRTRVRLTKVNEAGGMILEDFEFQMRCAGRLVYEGVTSFGFFADEALARQVGIRDAAARRWRPGKEDELRNLPGELNPDQGHEPFSPFVIRNSPFAREAGLPDSMLLMIDRIDTLIPDGGPRRLGYIRGSAAVDPAAWFFKAHFHQDPVWPGSLGLESFLQLLRVFAVSRRPRIQSERAAPPTAAAAEARRFEPIALGVEHHWTYRGQILPTNHRVEVEATVTRIEAGDRPLIVADGFLSVDGTTIYEMRDFALRGSAAGHL